MPIGGLLETCRISANMSQLDLANCVHKKDRFPPSPAPRVQAGMILNEIVHIEKYDAWTFSDQMLQTFWRNAFVCLNKADLWARHRLIWAVLNNIP
jgi:hypothetical protein